MITMTTMKTILLRLFYCSARDTVVVKPIVHPYLVVVLAGCQEFILSTIKHHKLSLFGHVCPNDTLFKARLQRESKVGVAEQVT